MILLFGGTSETAEISERIAALGHDVLVSTATEIDLDTGSNRKIRRRSGRMDFDEIKSLIRDQGVEVVIDASHPFATILRDAARKAAESLDVPYLTFTRPALAYDYEKLFMADDHDHAADIAFSFGETVLATTGSKDIKTYVERSIDAGVTLVARVLDHPGSIEACRAAGLEDDQIIAGRGPFTVEQNLEHIEKSGAGVIVTKDSGAAGGVGEKVRAAQLAGARVVIVRRPEQNDNGVFETIDGLIEEFGKITNETAA